jgi:predicted nucleotide-binding protein (sugar kinase/HSP70/actin superfamily)
LTNARPFIGVIGEVFVRSHAFSNQQLARRVEELGGRVWFSPLTEWLLYVNVNQKEDAWRGLNWAEIFRVGITDHIMKADERRLASPWQGLIPHLHESPPESLIAEGRRYVDPAFRGEAILGIGKAVEFHRQGLSGIINVMPFTCMPGLITAGVFKRFQADHDNIPVLNLAFEGQECGDLPIRLEAFLQQCRSYQQRRRKP